MSISQKLAVTNAILSMFPDFKLKGEVKLSDLLTTENKKELKAVLFEGFRAGEIIMSPEAQTKYANDDVGMNKYVNGLLDNWVRKNPEFNCGQKYVTKNPGSRAGSGDDKIRAMRNLKKTPGLTAETLAEIDTEIAKRLAEIKPAAAAAVINVEALPEHLRHLVKA